jgi:DNA helicase-2/ATP-dependent DNA helicase PcrA
MGRAVLPAQFIGELPQLYVDSIVHTENEHDVTSRIVTQLDVPNKHEASYLVDDMREFIMERFTRYGLSVSALNNYISCPWKYIFRNLIRLPDMRGYYLLLGTAVHSVIREYINRHKKGKTPTIDELVDYLYSTIDRFSANEKDIEQLRLRGHLIVTSYLNKRMVQWDSQREAEVIIPNIFLVDGVFINGKIDMIEYNQDKTVTVFDFKTGKTKSRNEILGLTKKADKSYFRQLTFYKLLLDLYKKGSYSMKNGVIEFVESGIDGELRQESFEITQDNLNELREEIIQMKESLSTMSFWDKRCDDEKCEYCRYQPYISQMLKRP